MRMLIVDGQPGERALCAAIGRELGWCAGRPKSAEEALERVESDAPELLLAELLWARTRLELLAEVKKRSPQTEVTLMSAYGTIESAVQAMRLGAYDFVVKPFRAEEFRLVLERMVEKAGWRGRRNAPRQGAIGVRPAQHRSGRAGTLHRAASF